MDTEEDSDRYVAQCFVNGLYAHDGEINLEKNDNLISNEYAVKLCLEYEVRKGKKLVKKELIVSLSGEIYFVQFIINPEEDEFELGLIFGRSFLRSANAIADFEKGTITIQPDFDPFLVSSDEEEKGSLKDQDDWDDLLDFDFDLDDLPPVLGNEPCHFTCKMGKSKEAKEEELVTRINQKYALLEEVRPVIETLAYQDGYKKLIDEIWADKVKLEGEIKKKEEEALMKVKGKTLKEEKDLGAFIFPIRLEGKLNENALADTGSDINTMPYRIYAELGREDIQKIDNGITMIDYNEAEAMGMLLDVLSQVGFTTLIAKFLVLDIPIDRDAPIVVGHGFLKTLRGKIDTANRIFSIFDGVCHQTFRAAKIEGVRIAESDSDDEEDSSNIQTVINPFEKISVWKKAVGFLGSLPVPLKDVEWRLDYKGFYNNPEEATEQWKTEIRITDPYGNIYTQAFRTKPTKRKLSRYHRLWEDMIMSREAKSHYNTKLANLLPKPIYSPNVVNWDVLNKMGCDGKIDEMLRIRLREAGTNEEIFTSVAWIRAFNTKESIYPELCYEFYLTYEFDEVCTNDELQPKKIIKYRLGGRNHNLTLLEFARRLGLYQAEELDEEGFDVYFQGGLCTDENFSAQEYWLTISTEDNLNLSRSSASKIQNLILRVLHKMITYSICQRTTRYDKIQKNDLWLLSMFDAGHQNGYASVAWVIARWMKRKGVGTQKESQICYGEFIPKLARKSRELTDEVKRSLSVPIHCRELDTTTLRELIDPEGRLIPKVPHAGAPRVGIPIPPRVSMNNLYERMGRMEIRQEAIEHMEYREHITHLDTLSPSMTSTISSTRISSNHMMMMMRSSVRMTRDDGVRTLRRRLLRCSPRGTRRLTKRYRDMGSEYEIGEGSGSQSGRGEDEDVGGDEDAGRDDDI
ncbi:retrotransposon ORF1 [Tanacetum coccineum]